MCCWLVASMQYHLIFSFSYKYRTKSPEATEITTGSSIMKKKASIIPMNANKMISYTTKNAKTMGLIPDHNHVLLLQLVNIFPPLTQLKPNLIHTRKSKQQKTDLLLSIILNNFFVICSINAKGKEPNFPAQHPYSNCHKSHWTRPIHSRLHHKATTEKETQNPRPLTTYELCLYYPISN